jgi:hypothetical protein
MHLHHTLPSQGKLLAQLSSSAVRPIRRLSSEFHVLRRGCPGNMATSIQRFSSLFHGSFTCLWPWMSSFPFVNLIRCTWDDRSRRHYWSSWNIVYIPVSCAFPSIFLSVLLPILGCTERKLQHLVSLFFICSYSRAFRMTNLYFRAWPKVYKKPSGNAGLRINSNFKGDLTVSESNIISVMVLNRYLTWRELSFEMNLLTPWP